MILEGLVTTRNSTGQVNLAPMGPIVDDAMSLLRLRPFQTSQTFRNLQQHPYGVFHVIDDVLLLAQGAIGRIEPLPDMFPAETIAGDVVRSTCRWYEFTVESCDDSAERAEIVARVVHTGRLRDFFGFNRAKHAVVEAAILATRVHLIPPDELLDALERLRPPVEKTAGPREIEAFRLLDNYIRDACPEE